MREIDARGLACPQPVILTRRAYLECPEENLLVLVDNEVARDNVLKMVQSLGCGSEVEQSEKDFRIYIRPVEGATAIKESAQLLGTSNPGLGSSTALQSSPSLMPAVGMGTVILIKSAVLGEGDKELGRVLMKSFLYTLCESPEGITAVICVNSGVYLTCEGSEVLEHLESLEDEGIEVLSCGTCLDFYKLKNQLRVGKISNMYSIVEWLERAGKVITV